MKNERTNTQSPASDDIDRTRRLTEGNDSLPCIAGVAYTMQNKKHTQVEGITCPRKELEFSASKTFRIKKPITLTTYWGTAVVKGLYIQGSVSLPFTLLIIPAAHLGSF